MAEPFALMTGGFAAAAGSTLVGYSLLGAPLEYLLAATVMNAPCRSAMAKIIWLDTNLEPHLAHVERTEGLHAVEDEADFDVRQVRDEESANLIDAVGRGALAGGRIAVTVGGLSIAFIALIAMANGILSRVGSLGRRGRAPPSPEAARAGRSRRSPDCSAFRGRSCPTRGRSSA